MDTADPAAVNAVSDPSLLSLRRSGAASSSSDGRRGSGAASKEDRLRVGGDELGACGGTAVALEVRELWLPELRRRKTFDSVTGGFDERVLEDKEAVEGESTEGESATAVPSKTGRREALELRLEGMADSLGSARGARLALDDVAPEAEVPPETSTERDLSRLTPGKRLPRLAVSLRLLLLDPLWSR